MTIRFRQIRLRAETGGGTFGADVVFATGLNVLWADNTKGKSTTLQAILYCLGLERMLSARREIPLTYVMTSHLIDPDSNEVLNVHESSVLLELSNGEGEIITVRRGVVGANVKLVSVFEGPHLTDPQRNYNQRDFFVLDPGAAQREAGFHRFLAEFMGWKLPIVRRFDATETPLYLETIFPLLYVEQKAGWSSIPAAFPTYLQVRDVAKRAVEFLLGLETHDVELRRQQIEIDVTELRASWLAKRHQLEAAARTINARVIGLSPIPIISTEDLGGMALEVLHRDKWIALAAAIEELESRVAALQDAAIPTVADMAPEAAAALEKVTRSIDELNTRRVRLLRDYRTESSQHSAAKRRIATLEEDLQKNLDVLKLRTLGSTAATPVFVVDHCPTCDQPIRDTLLPQSEVGEVMPIEDNVEYVRTQLSMFRQVAAQAETAMADSEAAMQIVTSGLRDANERLRTIRADLSASHTAPSAAAIGERLQAEQRLIALGVLSERFEGEREAFRELAEVARRLAEDKANLPPDRLTQGDRGKLDTLSDLIRSQAKEYEFTTFSADEITISPDTYRPEKEGFEIGFQLSASDAIRLKWAYQLALLELGRTASTNHPGFVIFDEPRQQEARRVSFQRLLKRASGSLQANEQVIFATSEDLDHLRGYLEGVDCNLIEFHGPIVQRVDAK